MAETNQFDGEFPETADGPILDERLIPEDILAPNDYVAALQNPEKKAIIQQFRTEVQEWIPAPRPDHHMHTDFYLCRYLIARDWNFNAAKEMFITAMKWRKDNDIDGIIKRFESSEYFDLIVNYWPCSVHRKWDFWTYDNSFVIYERIGSMDCSLIDIVPFQAIIDYHIWVVEVIEQKHAKIANKKGYSPGGIVIEDLSGLGWAHAHMKVLEYLTQIAKIDESYYPAILRKYYIINAPYVFTIFWKTVQTVLSAKTVAKFEILGCDRAHNESVLKKVIPEKYLPDYLGGKSTFVMPKAGHQPELVKLLPKPSYAHIVTVPSRGSHTHKITISNPSVIHWDFITKDYDIGFQVTFKSLAGKETEIIKTYRAPSNNQTQKGRQLFEEAGDYVFTWDNSYSFWNSKELSFNIEALPTA